MKRASKPKSSEQMTKNRIHGIYRGFVKRHGEKLWKSGRRKGMIRQVAVPVPFSEAELLKWALSKGEVFPCIYCNALLTAMTVSPDHATPLARGGGLGLDNLVAACRPCNAYKGALTAEEYMILRGGIARLDPAGQRDVLQRLKSGGFRWHSIKPKQDVAA